MDCNFLISRLPIFGSQVSVVAYELLSSPIAKGPRSPLDAERALFEMLSESGLEDIVGSNDCFITLTSQGLAEALWKALPPNRVIFGFFDEEFQPSDQVAKNCEELMSQGYRLTISDRLHPKSLDLLANRVYAIQLSAIGYVPEDLGKRVEELRRYKTKLLATNVDTWDDLEFCTSLEFDLYQGRFVTRSASQAKEIPVSRVTLVRVLAQLQQPDMSISELETLISQDVSLSFKLLRYANSAAVALPRKVASIGHAVRMVGMELLRNWTTVLLMSSVEDKPRELMTIALIRARMCEKLSESLKDAEPEPFFSAGLLSVLDALLDCPMEKAVAELPLVDEVRAALIQKTGPIGQALRCALSYERADWDNVQFYGMPPQPIRDTYVEALSWARQLTSGLLS